MKGTVMEAIKLEVRTRIAWWVRPALALVLLCGCICPARVDGWIDAIVDRGVKVELT